MPAHFAEVLLRVYTKDFRFVYSPKFVTDLITELRYSFFGRVQAGYRSLLARIAKESEPTCIDVQGSESDGIPERSRTPRTYSRVSSFNKSFSVGPGDSGEDASPFLNQFTTVSKGYGKSLASPSKLFAPQPVSAAAANLGLVKEQMEAQVYPALQAPTSPTRAKPGTKHVLETLAEADEDIQDSGKSSPSRILRTGKRLRNERGESKTVEESHGGGKRKRV
jgi:hypothetical protein